MKPILGIILLFTSLLAIAAPEEARLEAVLKKAEGNNGYIVDLYSKDKLEAPKFQHFTGTWEDFFDGVETKDGRYLYRVKAYHDVTPNVILYVKENEKKVTQFVVPQLDETAETVALLNRGLKPLSAQAVQDGPQAVQQAYGTGDPGLDAINQARAARGIPPIQYDPNFAAVSRQNNAMGGGHAYPGHGYQTWAGTGSPQGAVNMWLSPRYFNSHGVIILNRGITRGGTHSSGGHTTFSGR